jgi:hypothetical protein
MADADWTDAENDAIVAAYFEMLKLDLAGSRFVKAEHVRVIQSTVNGRSRKSVEYKLMNVSAALIGFGQPLISGYAPKPHYQNSLDDAVWRWLASNPDWTNSAKPQHRRPPTTAFEDASDVLWIGPPPTASNAPPSPEMIAAERVSRKFDVAALDASNRVLGRAGEERAFIHERAFLREEGRDDLANAVRWVSNEEGDGAGYDIASFELDGRRRLIEVKTTNGWSRTPFHISRNELRMAERHRDTWCLLRLWNFAREPKGFELRPPLDRHVALTSTSFMAKPL